jgi:hypothetical protein
VDEKSSAGVQYAIISPLLYELESRIPEDKID